MSPAEANDLVRTILSVVLTLNIVLAIITLILERRDSSSLWAWILVMTFIPVLGFALYVFIGRRPRRSMVKNLLEGAPVRDEHRADAQRAAIARSEYEFENNSTETYVELASLLMSDDGAALTHDNEVQVFHDGGAKFDALVADIAAARDHVHIYYYIFKSDGLGMRIIDALTERAQAGVEVRFFYDALGGRHLRKQRLSALRAAGGQIYTFFPSRLGPLNVRVNYRTHRKLVVIDGTIGYIGGFNVGDEYLGLDPKFGYWRDTHLRIRGGAVASIQNRLLMDWNGACRPEAQVSFRSYYFPPVEDRPGDVAVQIVSSGPSSRWERVKYGYLKMITSAQSSILIQTPYFVPDIAILDALKIAARSGVDVRLMIPDKPDHPFVYPATLSYADELVSAGAKVHIYRNGFLHAKTLLVDGEVASVGTANFDVRSFGLNFEVNAFLYDKGLGAQLTHLWEQDLTHCTLFDHDQVYRRPLLGRIKEGASRLVAPLL